jgi:hypothetical protein
MKLILFVTALSSCLLANAQENSKETIEFLNEARKIHRWGDSLVYTDGFDTEIINDMCRLLTVDTMWTYKSLPSGKIQRVEAISFTKEEKTFIQDQLLKCKRRIWSDQLLSKSRLVKLDTIQDFFSKNRDLVRKKRRESLAHFKQELLDTITPTNIYSFSIPIMIRNNSICFFRYAEYYLDTGGKHGEQFSIYKKVNGKWQFINWYIAG